MTYEMLDMYKIKVGDAIRHFRKLKKMRQHQLAKCDEPSESIFSLRKVIRVENGKASLTVQELKWVLSTLGVTLQEFYSYIEGCDILSFQNDFAEIWQLCYRNNFQEAIQQLETLKGKANTDNPEIKQAILLCEGAIQKR